MVFRCGLLNIARANAAKKTSYLAGVAQVPMDAHKEE